MKNITVFLFSFMMAVSLIAVDAKAKEWRGIIPLHSTRADVERLLGPPVSDPLTGPCRCVYQFDDVIVHISYANGLRCGEAEERDSRVGGWKVPRDTVVEIVIRFRTDQPLSDFKIDEKYEKEADEHLPGVTFHTNREDGVRIEGGRFTVSSASYFPAVKDNHLRCPKSTDKSLGRMRPESCRTPPL